MKKFVFILIIGFGSVSCWAQQSDFAALLESGTEDAELLTMGYLKPLYNAAGFGMAGGWINTAATHDKFGVDFMISVGFLSVPQGDLFYRTDQLGMENTVQLNGNIAPTIFGPSGEETRPEYRFTDPETGETADFTGPEGIGLAEHMDDLLGVNRSVAPVPMMNLGVGLPMGTDVRIRWFPTIRAGDDTRINFWGIGVKHDITRYLNIGEKFDLSVFAGLTSLRVRTDLRNDIVTTENDIISTDGEGSVSLQSIHLRGMISKKLSVFTFFGGPGYTIIASRTEVNGTYSYESANEQKTVTDPISFNYGTGGITFTAGLRVQLVFITLHTAYNFQRYNSLEFGFGVSID